jgi:hypothetical protein
MTHISKVTQTKTIPKIGEKTKRDYWINIYPTYVRGHAYPTKQEADRASGFNRIACVKVTAEYEEGEGL